MNTAAKESESTAANRKPAQMEMIGGKSARQRIWEEICKLKNQVFWLNDVAFHANVEVETARTYIKSLVAGEFLTPAPAEGRRKFRYYQIKHNGIEAPRLDRKGKPVTQGLSSECMWRTLRILKGELDVAKLTAHISASGIDINTRYAKAYITALKKAGYLQITRPGGPNRLERFFLKPAMNTGPRAPQVQRVKTVYDPNLNKVMHCEDPEELS
ncbi:hypothetical protein [Neptuniibacter marinus]|uniref:hypothetical protein n=1 Tax=Neptuniibacter marinus TaxID=1806670 RepID=UPI003B5C3259